MELEILRSDNLFEHELILFINKNMNYIILMQFLFIFFSNSNVTSKLGFCWSNNNNGRNRQWLIYSWKGSMLEIDDATSLCVELQKIMYDLSLHV